MISFAAMTASISPATRRSFGLILPCLWPQGRRDLRFRVVLSFVFMVLGKSALMTAPFLYKIIIDKLTGDAPATADEIVAASGIVVAALIIAYGFSRIATSVFNQLQDGCFSRVTQHAVREFADRLFRHVHRLPLAYHLERRTGEVNQIIDRSRSAIEIFLRYSLIATVPTLFEVLIVTIVMGFYLGIWFALIVMLMLGFYVWFTFYTTRWRTQIRARMNASRARISGCAVDSLLNYETIKYFHAENHEAKRHDAECADYADHAIDLTRSLAILNAGQAAIFATGMTVAMLLALYYFRAGTLTLGDFVMVNALLIQLQMPLSFLGSLYRDAKQSLVDLEKAVGLLEIAPEAVVAPSLLLPPPSRLGVIRFDHVSFGYTPQNPILHDLNFTLQPGETVALVGVSGGGKSTITRLLYRFYDPSSGRICVDDTDIARLDRHQWRRFIGVVPQDTVLFNETLRYNIAYGEPNASAADIDAAIHIARLDELIGRLPEGDRTMVGERGLKLSGGERQRVGIARTILKDAPLWIFDEATSALDLATEREIRKTLLSVSRGRTNLMITHRLSELSEIDRILVIDKGRFVETGNHAKLIASGGVYARLWNSRRKAPSPADNHVRRGS